MYTTANIIALLNKWEIPVENPWLSLNSMFHWLSHVHNSKLISYNYLTDSITIVPTQTNAVLNLKAEVNSTCSQKTSMVPFIKQHYYGCDRLWSVNVVFHPKRVFVTGGSRSFYHAWSSWVFCFTHFNWDIIIYRMCLHQVFMFTGLNQGWYLA